MSLTSLRARITSVSRNREFFFHILYFLVYTLFTETRLKLPVTHVTSPPPSVAKTQRVRKLENVENPAKRKSFSRNAKKSND